jgi:hypothetical protein
MPRTDGVAAGQDRSQELTDHPAMGDVVAARLLHRNDSGHARDSLDRSCFAMGKQKPEDGDSRDSTGSPDPAAAIEKPTPTLTSSCFRSA